MTATLHTIPELQAHQRACQASGVDSGGRRHHHAVGAEHAIDHRARRQRRGQPHSRRFAILPCCTVSVAGVKLHGAQAGSGVRTRRCGERCQPWLAGTPTADQSIAPARAADGRPEAKGGGGARNKSEARSAADETDEAGENAIGRVLRGGQSSEGGEPGRWRDKRAI